MILLCEGPKNFYFFTFRLQTIALVRHRIAKRSRLLLRTKQTVKPATVIARGHFPSSGGVFRAQSHPFHNQGSAMPRMGYKGCENFYFYSDCPLHLLLLSLSFCFSHLSCLAPLERGRVRVERKRTTEGKAAQILCNLRCLPRSWSYNPPLATLWRISCAQPTLLPSG